MSGELSTRNRTERLRGFLSAWRSHAPERAQVKRMDAFLSAYRQHRPPPPIVVARPKLDPARLGSFLTAAQPPLEQLRASGTMINPWGVAGVGRKEVRNSAVLATLWSPQQCGALGRAFLEAFCRRINDPAGLLPTSEELAASYSVRTEHCPVGAVSERVDITIEGPSFVLGIEVKIDAAEGPEQLRRYVGSVQRWGKQRGGKKAAVVFLAPFYPSEQGVLRATWRDVMHAGRDVLRLRAGAPTTHSFLLETFVRHCIEFGR
ncbi:MAG: PD-(D/E)XK nuclease family protein [Sphingomonas sp.]|uniref:PD-(D/E)XK nuclease family protein n=1 Tax=Sphingomonas sp. TaxID=28214 RepID=UPI00260CC1A2|nr:PD-(D/E)XK nuclease family protein [Sphingomonas sp.]MDK2767903.1 PD-(D/E)XK nuclease family protein [Sphingomonas sp.]